MAGTVFKTLKSNSLFLYSGANYANISTALTSIRNITIPNVGTNTEFVLSDGASDIKGTKTFTSGTTFLKAPAATSAILQLNGNNTDVNTTGFQLYTPSANNKITIASKATGADLIDITATDIILRKQTNIINGNSILKTWLQNTSVATGASTVNIAQITFTGSMHLIASFQIFALNSDSTYTALITKYYIRNNAGTVTYSLLFTDADYDQTINPGVAANTFYFNITQSGTFTRIVNSYISVMNASASTFTIPDSVV